MAEILTIFRTLIVVACMALIIAKARKVFISSNWYKMAFAYAESHFAETARKVYAPLKEKLFSDFKHHLTTVRGDVLEIGIGAGENFAYYPDGISLIAVDSNPHVEALLKKTLEKTGHRIHLKQFVAASAEDMRCTGKIDLEENSVAAVVCTLVLCSLTEDQTRKTMREVERVLMPGGRFYFLDHVAGKPWTFQYLVQQLLSKSLIWPTFSNGCQCNREPLPLIKEAGFKNVKAEKVWMDWTPDKFAHCKSHFSLWISRVALQIINSTLYGFAEKGR